MDAAMPARGQDGGPTPAASGRDQPVPADVLEAAIAWQLRLEEGAAAEGDAASELDPVRAELRRAWQDWLAAHPDHGRAWHQLGQIGQQWGALAELSWGPAARRALQNPGKGARLPAAGTALGLAMAVLLGLTLGLTVLDRFQPVGQLLADHRTATGERRTIVLPDRTVLHLNTRSAADIAFDDAVRAVHLREGEIAVETPADDEEHEDDHRPFVIVTPDGSLRALGTRFTARRLDGDGGTQLTVTQAAVAARPRGCASTPVEACDGERIVAAGQTVRLHGGRVGEPGAAAPEVDAWKDGMLVVENLPLVDVVAALARHRPGRLAVDPRVAQLRVTGTLPLADTDQALVVLAAAVPVEVVRTTRWWLTVAPRAGQ